MYKHRPMTITTGTLSPFKIYHYLSLQQSCWLDDLQFVSTRVLVTWFDLTCSTFLVHPPRNLGSKTKEVHLLHLRDRTSVTVTSIADPSTHKEDLRRHLCLVSRRNHNEYRERYPKGRLSTTDQFTLHLRHEGLVIRKSQGTLYTWDSVRRVRQLRSRGTGHRSQRRRKPLGWDVLGHYFRTHRPFSKPLGRLIVIPTSEPEGRRLVPL